MTDHLVERVAQAICDARYPHQAASTVRAAESLMLARAAIAAIREAEPTTQLRNILGDIRDFCTDEADHRDIDRLASWALDLLAEPLTSTPESSTTETDGEAAISQDPPPGFEWEYRAVTGSTWRDEPLPHWRKVERRLVGKPERMED